MIIYLIFGACVFTVLEHPSEVEEFKAMRELKRAFVAKYGNFVNRKCCLTPASSGLSLSLSATHSSATLRCVVIVPSQCLDRLLFAKNVCLKVLRGGEKSAGRRESRRIITHGSFVQTLRLFICRLRTLIADVITRGYRQ